MKKYGVFDILGPIMIGPSSSHTAGAARLGKVARTIANDDIKKVEFLLHGSFAKTYKGHGTDRALVAGILGMEPSDVRLREALSIAKDEGIEVNFVPADLGNQHPNTVKFLITNSKNEIIEVMGSSIGGGSIVVTEVNGKEVNFTGEYPTIIICNKDIPGVVSMVTTILFEINVNIAFMKVFRNEKGKEATMIFEVDTTLPPDLKEKIKLVSAVKKVTTINPVRGAM